MPPLASQADFDFAGSHPLPLQLFCPLHALSAVLQAPWPLQALIPTQWTAAFLAEAEVVERPFKAKATAATARVVPVIVLVFIIYLLGKGLEADSKARPSIP